MKHAVVSYGGTLLKMLLAALLLQYASLRLPAQTSADISRQKDRSAALQRDMDILKKQIDAASRQSSQALSTLSMVQSQKKSRQRLIAVQDGIIRAYDDSLRALTRQLRSRKAALDTLQARYDRLVLGAYKNRDVKLWYMYVLSGADVAQALRRFAYFKNLSARIDTQARLVEKARADLEARKSALAALKAEAAAQRSKRSAEFEALQKDEAAAKALVAKLKKNSKAYKASLKAKQQEKAALDAQIAKMLASASRSKNKKPVDYALAQSFEQNKGRLPRPVEGPVVEGFGAYKHSDLHLSMQSDGITIACEEGSKIKVVFDGVVVSVGLIQGYGQCVLVQHGDYYTTYCKLRSACVRQGDRLNTGDAVGEVATIMGKTCLHFRIWRQKYLNPEQWLR